MSRPDIYSNIQPIQYPNPLDQASKAISLQSMMQGLKSQQLQQQDVQEQIDQRRQANAEEQRAAKVFRDTMDSLPSDAKPEDRDTAIISAFNRQGMTKRAEDYTKMQSDVRKSLAEADTAKLTQASQELKNKTEAAELHARVWNGVGDLPDDKIAQSYQYHLPLFVQQGLIDPNDPTVPPATADAQTIKNFAKSQSIGGLNTKDFLEHTRQLANDAIENKRKEAETAQANANLLKTNAEIAGTLPTEEQRNYKAWLPEFANEFKSSHGGRPPIQAEARAAFEASKKPPEAGKEVPFSQAVMDQKIAIAKAEKVDPTQIVQGPDEAGKPAFFVVDKNTQQSKKVEGVTPKVGPSDAPVQLKAQIPAAMTTLSMIDKVRDIVKNNPELVGPAAGRLVAASQGIGSTFGMQDPEKERTAATLAGHLGYLFANEVRSAMPGRPNPEITKRLEAISAQLKQNPNMMEGFLKSAENNANIAIDNGAVYGIPEAVALKAKRTNATAGQDLKSLSTDELFKRLTNK